MSRQFKIQISKDHKNITVSEVELDGDKTRLNKIHDTDFTNFCRSNNVEPRNVPDIKRNRSLDYEFTVGVGEIFEPYLLDIEVHEKTGKINDITYNEGHDV